LLVAAVAVAAFLQTPAFGSLPSARSMERIRNSRFFSKGQFQNLSPTPNLTEGATFPGVLKRFFFEKDKRVRPAKPLPVIKTDLRSLSVNDDVLVWFGHSSYYFHLGGHRFLVDPVFSGSASPVSFTTKSFEGTEVYSPADFPPIDFLIITHDHYDHLDYETVRDLQPTVKKVITGLGVAAHLRRWGYAEDKLVELEWEQMIQLDENTSIRATAARHFSGRGFSRNRSQWSSFVLQTTSGKIFIGGDSGYDSHFKKIGEAYGPFDLAVLECGQYNEDWRYIHTLPEEVVQAAMDLEAEKILPVHWGKFTLALHAWDEPIQRVLNEAVLKHMPVFHPKIGQPINWKSEAMGTRWWEGIDAV